ncbi:MAG: type II toxin-antitoxin system VapC family toxin [Deltaproteobacteria bacterium]|nr:type II toxin-antitoxin system VapC family toxin [Deltaproteobacteria bacterium]
MKKAFLIDTDVMVDFFRGQRQAVELIRENSASVILSAMVVVELYAGYRSNQERDKIDRLVSHAKVIPVSAQLASYAGLYLKQYAKSHGIDIADAVIAATAEDQNAELKTLNVKHYPMFETLKPAYRKS